METIEVDKSERKAVQDGEKQLVGAVGLRRGRLGEGGSSRMRQRLWLSNVMLLSCAARCVTRHSRGGRPGSNGALEQAICRVEMHQRRETPSAAEEWAELVLVSQLAASAASAASMLARRCVVASPLGRCTQYIFPLRIESNPIRSMAIPIRQYVCLPFDIQ